MRYDVIVVGAGPAGCAATYHLAKEQVNVLLLDKATFPREKACGDAIMPPAYQELEAMGLGDQVQQFHPVKQVAVTRSSTSFTHPIGEPAYTAPRFQFDAMLQSHVTPKCSWRGGMKVVSFHQTHSGITIRAQDQQGQYHQFEAELVIAADGSRSRIATLAREMMIAREAWHAISLPHTHLFDPVGSFTATRAYYEHIPTDEDTLTFYFPQDQDETTFYYWVFPLSSHLTNVGWISTLQQSRMKTTSHQHRIDYFFTTLLSGRGDHARQVTPWMSAPIASGMRNAAFYADRILCVGDAAALVAPHSAEGISGALWSGREAASTALEAFHRGNFSSLSLQEYGDKIRDHFRYEPMLQHIPW